MEVARQNSRQRSEGRPEQTDPSAAQITGTSGTDGAGLADEETSKAAVSDGYCHQVAMNTKELHVQAKQLSYMTARSKVTDVSRLSKLSNKLGPVYPSAAGPHQTIQNDLQIFKIVFEVFDRERTGYINKEDVIAITVSMRQDFKIVVETLEEIQRSARLSMQQPADAAGRSSESDIHQDGEMVSFGEFATLLWQVELKQQQLKAEEQRLPEHQGRSAPRELAESEEMVLTSGNQAPRRIGGSSKEEMTDHGVAPGHREELELQPQVSDIPRRKEYVLNLKIKRAGRAIAEDDSENFDQFDLDLQTAVYPQQHSEQYWKLDPNRGPGAQEGRPDAPSGGRMGRTAYRPTHLEEATDQAEHELAGPGERAKANELNHGLRPKAGSPSIQNKVAPLTIQMKQGRALAADLAGKYFDTIPETVPQSIIEANDEVSSMDEKQHQGQEPPEHAPNPADMAQNRKTRRAPRLDLRAIKDAARTGQKENRDFGGTARSPAPAAKNLMRTQRTEAEAELSAYEMTSTRKHSVLRSKFGSMPSQRASHPLELRSKQSSLSKIEKAGFRIDHPFSFSQLEPQSSANWSKSTLARFLQTEYGELIPKVNLTSLPDFKVTEFIRILNQYHKKMEAHQQYLEAKRTRFKIKELAQVELVRQIKRLQEKHQAELRDIEDEQTKYSNDFLEKWSRALADEEAEAIARIKELKEVQQVDLVLKHKEASEESHLFSFSKQYCELKAREDIFLKVKQYIDANNCRLEAERLEHEEREAHSDVVQEKVEKVVHRLREQQKGTMKTAMKRAQRDREEQLRQRKQETDQLLKRNRNEIKDLLRKQRNELKTLIEFMRFSLGKRAPRAGSCQEDDFEAGGESEDLDRLIRIEEPRKSTELRLNLEHGAEVERQEHEEGLYTEKKKTDLTNYSRLSRMQSTAAQKMSNLFEHDKKAHGKKPAEGHKTARGEGASRSSSPRLASPRLQSRDQPESSWSPTPRAISQLNTSRVSHHRREESTDAYVPDRKPTIHESACVNFIGVKEQRPAELLKMELQNTVPARKSFYSRLDNGIDEVNRMSHDISGQDEGDGQYSQSYSRFGSTARESVNIDDLILQNKTTKAKLRDVNEYLKSKYENYKEFNNISARETKIMPFFENVRKSLTDKGIDVPHAESSLVQNTSIRRATILKRLNKLRVNKDLINKSNNFCKYQKNVGQYRKEVSDCIKKQFWLPSKSSIKNQLIHYTGTAGQDRESEGQITGRANQSIDHGSSYSCSDGPSRIELKEIERIGSFKKLSQAQRNLSQMDNFVMFSRHAQTSMAAYNTGKVGQRRGLSTIHDPVAAVPVRNNDLIVGAQNVTVNKVVAGKERSKQMHVPEASLKELPQIKSEQVVEHSLPHEERRQTGTFDVGDLVLADTAGPGHPTNQSLDLSYMSPSAVKASKIQKNYVNQQMRQHDYWPKNPGAFNRIKLGNVPKEPSQGSNAQGRSTGFWDYTDGTAYTLRTTSQGVNVRTSLQTRGRSTAMDNALSTADRSDRGVLLDRADIAKRTQSQLEQRQPWTKKGSPAKILKIENFELAARTQQAFLAPPKRTMPSTRGADKVLRPRRVRKQTKAATAAREARNLPQIAGARARNIQDAEVKRARTRNASAL